jgi:hypothetical protein
MAIAFPVERFANRMAMLFWYARFWYARRALGLCPLTMGSHRLEWMELNLAWLLQWGLRVEQPLAV